MTKLRIYMVNTDEKYIHRCIELAKLGAGSVAPNPMVGAVVVRDNQIIGEGYHRVYGEPHAEVNAITSVKNKEWLKESTIYVSLEPCAHYGKTPPCAELIIASGIPRVVVGSGDPFAEVAGKGIEMLRAKGIEVKVGVLKEDCNELNKTFFTYHQKKRPFIYLKWAQTIDGYIDLDRSKPELGQPTWISNEYARILVHKQRTEVDALLIGTNTAFKDNPSLTVRDWEGKQPLRMVIDRNNRLPEHLHLKDGECQTIIFTAENVPDSSLIKYVQLDFNSDIIPQLMAWMYENKVQSVVVEGGNLLLHSFIAANLWDEAHVYIGNTWFGSGVKAPDFNAFPQYTAQIQDTSLKVFKN
ncbi:MAG: bifunctional diaminohydroxyphosphoribosylaminopyrimidine deaminase/5-amino-6-(5-phosphoribosylamino)uracil reductase RibD [Mangrovibacterium sp.]